MDFSLKRPKKKGGGGGAEDLIKTFITENSRLSRVKYGNISERPSHVVLFFAK